MNTERIARRYLTQGIQHWGQSAAERERATRDYVEAAGLEFGSNEANEWLEGVLKGLRRGEFFDEAQQLLAAIERRAVPSPQETAE